MKTLVSMKTAALSLTLALAACGGGGGGSNGGAVNTQQASLPDISWHSATKTLVERYCVGCHTEGSALAPFPLETYAQVKGKSSAIIYTLENDTMPPMGFTDVTPSDLSTLTKWFNDGAPEGDPSQAQYAASTFTYHADARRIIEDNCEVCHVDGGVAPFALDSYEKVKSVAAAAAFSVHNGTMPPWPPTPGYSRLIQSRTLAPQDEYTLLNWLQSDMQEGDPADYVPAKEEEPLDIDFNLQLKLPAPYTPTLRPDDHRCFAIDWPMDELTYVIAVDAIPDQVAEVHHIIVNIIEPQDVHHYAGAGGEDGRPGWSCLGSGGIEGAPLPRQIGGWVPGSAPGTVPEGTGMPIEPGSILVVQIHYNTLVAEPTPDQSVVLVSTTDEVPRPASGFLYTNPTYLGGGVMIIPAGKDDVHHGFTVPASILVDLFGAPAGLKAGDSFALHNGFIHMHSLGKTGRTTVVRADGTEQIVVDIRDWDFNWQATYGLEKELRVNPGDLFRLECSWDNSAENQVIVDGVQLPPREVDWGDGTGDEMCLTNLYVTKLKEGYDYSYAASVHIASPEYRQKYAAGDLVPLELLFNNFTLHEPGAHGGDDEHHEGGEHTMDEDDHTSVYEGHYHIYLDTDDDNAEHLTAWDASYYYQLPDDIQPGLHTIRVSLRGTDHHALGIQESVVIEVAEGDAASSSSLISVNDWVEQAAADDGIAGHRPVSVECPSNSWYNEDGALEVETGFCNYLSLAQASKADVQDGDTLHLVLWHGNLAFEQPATAHVAITLDGQTVWEENVDIPTDAEIFDIRIPVDFDAPAGSKLEYHLHNHGYNSWTLLELEVER
ncbi:MAG: mono/diheme cytochrome c family protein [Bacteroidia bacterium]|jgi:mono/diheme cytochrome c family protein